MKKFFRTYVTPLKDGKTALLCIGVPLIPLSLSALFSRAPVFPVSSFILFTALLLTVNFFRNPERKIRYRAGSVYAPADGVITSIERVKEKEYLNRTCVRIKIFMNIFNVHRNRIPLSGEVELVKYKKGRMQAAFREVEESNEQFVILLRTRRGKILFKQIAGLIARRVVCGLRTGDTVKTGALFGMIKFGSAVVVYLPEKMKITVKTADKVKAGLSEIARTGRS